MAKLSYAHRTFVITNGTCHVHPETAIVILTLSKVALRALRALYQSCPARHTAQQQRVIKLARHASLLKLLLHSAFDFLLSLDSTALKVLVLPLEALFVLGERAVHDAIEVLLYLLYVLLGAHKALHKNVELFVQSNDFNARISGSIVIEHGLGPLHVLFLLVERVNIRHIIGVGRLSAP